MHGPCTTQSPCAGCQAQQDAGQQALKLIATLDDIEREIKELSPDERLHIRRLRARPAERLVDGATPEVAHWWRYSQGYGLQHKTLRRAAAPHRRRRTENRQQRSREPDPADRAGEKELVVRRHDSYQYLKHVLERLQTLFDSRLRELLPYCWTLDSAA